MLLLEAGETRDIAETLPLSYHSLGAPITFLLLLLEGREGIPNIILSLRGEDTMSVLLGI